MIRWKLNSDNAIFVAEYQTDDGNWIALSISSSIYKEVIQQLNVYIKENSFMKKTRIISRGIKKIKARRVGCCG